MPLIANNIIINGKIVEPTLKVTELGKMNEVPILIFDKKKAGRESQYIKDMLSLDNE